MVGSADRPRGNSRQGCSVLTAIFVSKKWGAVHFEVLWSLALLGSGESLSRIRIQ